jgi:hypothetical protein
MGVQRWMILKRGGGCLSNSIRHGGLQDTNARQIMNKPERSRHRQIHVILVRLNTIGDVRTKDAMRSVQSYLGAAFSSIPIPIGTKSQRRG